MVVNWARPTWRSCSIASTKKYETIFCAQGELFGIPQLKTLTDGYLETVRRAGSEYAGAGISPETRDGLLRPFLSRG